MNEEAYPDRFFRGINPVFCEYGYLLPEAFQLDPVREDGYCEVSITWDDEPEAFRVIASQKKDDGSIQFKGGIAEIERKELDQKLEAQIRIKNLAYERRPTTNNKYHGNLLILNALDKTRKTMIKSQLALLGAKILPNPFIEAQENALDGGANQ